MENQRIIQSILDTDLYKLTMQNAIMQIFRDVHVTYKFIDRGQALYPHGFIKKLREQIEFMSELQLTEDELNFLKSIDYLNDSVYLDFLKGYKFDPSEIIIKERIHDHGEQFDLYVKGPWYRTVLWETPLLATISELYNQMTNQITWSDKHLAYNSNKAKHYASLSNDSIKIADFGTRRRNCYTYHSSLINEMINLNDGFVGTSNVHLAHKYNITPIGTYAHEWVSGNAAILGYKHGNQHSMENWVKVYRGRLGIALTDTFGIDSFLKDFDIMYSKLFDGVRHDSGDPFNFANKIVNHYKNHGIDPETKTIIFSDGLNPDKVKQIYDYCQRIRVGCAFGIGTKLTNDIVPALNIVMKLIEVDGSHAIKMPDEEGKNTGDQQTIRSVKYLLYGKSK